MIRIFEARELEEAVAHALAGGVALHLHRLIPDRTRAPRCFVRAVDRGESIAHLFDQDRAALVRLARQLGVKVINVERAGTERQHIDLVGKPLRRAMSMGTRGAAP